MEDATGYISKQELYEGISGGVTTTWNARLGRKSLRTPSQGLP